MNSDSIKNIYLNQIKHIKIKKCSYNTKLKLIEGLLQKLRFMDNNPQLMSLIPVQKSFIYQTPQAKKSSFIKQQTLSQNQSTSYSFYSDNSQILGSGSASDYEQKIMQKRVIKFQINQQIQALQDDLFQIQKVVETKRIFNDELAKTIQKRMKQVGQNTKINKDDNLLSKGSNKLSRKQVHNYDAMNITVSGASGFGFVNKKRDEVNMSLNSTLKQQINVNNLNHLNVDTSNVQRKKARSHYLGKSITGIFKNILK